jgi:hypothetical protein
MYYRTVSMYCSADSSMHYCLDQCGGGRGYRCRGARGTGLPSWQRSLEWSYHCRWSKRLRRRWQSCKVHHSASYMHYMMHYMHYMHYMMHIVHYSAWWRSVEGDRVCPYRSWCKGSDREDLPLCFVLFTLAIAISHSTPLDKLTVTAEREGHRCSLLATLHDTFDPPFQSFSLYLPMRVPAWHRGKQPVPYTLSRRGAVAHWLTVVCLENSTGCASSLLRVMRCDICSAVAWRHLWASF